MGNVTGTSLADHLSLDAFLKDLGVIQRLSQWHQRLSEAQAGEIKAGPGTAPYGVIRAAIKGLLDAEKRLDSLGDGDRQVFDSITSHWTELMSTLLGESALLGEMVTAERMFSLTAAELFWQDAVERNLRPEVSHLRYLVELLPQVRDLCESPWPNEHHTRMAIQKIAGTYARMLSYLAVWLPLPDTKSGWPCDARLTYDEARERVRQALAEWGAAFDADGSDFDLQLQECVEACIPRGKSLPQILFEYEESFDLLEAFLKSIDDRVAKLEKGSAKEKWGLLHSYVGGRALVLWRLTCRFYATDSELHYSKLLDLAGDVLQWIPQLVSPAKPDMLEVVAQMLEMFGLHERNARIREEVEAKLEHIKDCYDNSWRTWSDENAAFAAALRRVNASGFRLRASISGQFRRDSANRLPVEVDSNSIHDKFVKLCSRDAVEPLIPTMACGSILNARDCLPAAVPAQAGPPPLAGPPTIASDSLLDNSQQIDDLPGLACSIHNKSADCSGFCLALPSGNLGEDCARVWVEIGESSIPLKDCVLCVPFEVDGNPQWLIATFECRGKVRRGTGDDRLKGENVVHVGVKVDPDSDYLTHNLDAFRYYFESRFKLLALTKAN